MTTTTLVERLFNKPLATVADYYARHLNDFAHQFLSKSCLSADEALRVGFADRTLGKQLPEKNLKAGRELRATLKQLGVLKASGHESLRGFVTVPLTDTDGNTTGIYGLRIDNKGKDQPQLTVGHGIFNATALTSFAEIIVWATVLDAWTFHAAGHTNVVAIEGQPLKKEHFNRTKRILLANVSLDESAFEGIEVMRIHFPEGTTVNDYAIQNRKQDDALGKRIRAASITAAPVANVVKTFVTPEPAQPKLSTSSATEERTTKERPSLPIASPTPAPIDDIEVERSDTETTLRIESRRWRVRGWSATTLPAF